MRITTEDLRAKAKEIEELLTKYGYNVKLQPYFAYGKYSYYGNFYPDKDCQNVSRTRQVSIYMGSKRECYDRLDYIVTQALKYEKFYKFTNGGDMHWHSYA